MPSAIKKQITALKNHTQSTCGYLISIIKQTPKTSDWRVGNVMTNLTQIFWNSVPRLPN